MLLIYFTCLCEWMSVYVHVYVCVYVCVYYSPLPVNQVHPVSIKWNVKVEPGIEKQIIRFAEYFEIMQLCLNIESCMLYPFLVF